MEENVELANFAYLHKKKMLVHDVHLGNSADLHKKKCLCMLFI